MKGSLLSNLRLRRVPLILDYGGSYKDGTYAVWWSRQQSWPSVRPRLLLRDCRKSGGTIWTGPAQLGRMIDDISHVKLQLAIGKAVGQRQLLILVNRIEWYGPPAVGWHPFVIQFTICSTFIPLRIEFIQAILRLLWRPFQKHGKANVTVKIALTLATDLGFQGR